MKLDFLALADDERQLYMTQAAIARGVSPIIIEKDFWVCWVLSLLFTSEFASHFVFKGGTSLSKVFGVIDRFSEDVDLSLSPEFLNLPKARESHTQGTKWMEQAVEACSEAVKNRIAPVLEAATQAVLGKGTGNWFQFEFESNTKSPVLLFNYPCSQNTGFDYLKRSVKLEFGSLTDQQPAGRHPLRPWIAETFPEPFKDWQCEVVAMEAERTFWEKATILHMEYHRAADKPTPLRYSRHYADVAALAKHSTASAAIDRRDLRERVVEWKNHYFFSAWAHYDTAKPGTFHLVPPEARRRELRNDYVSMREMYLNKPSSFDAILVTLSEIEALINDGR